MFKFFFPGLILGKIRVKYGNTLYDKKSIPNCHPKVKFVYYVMCMQGAPGFISYYGLETIL